MSIDITKHDAVKACEQTFPLSLLDIDNKTETGIIMLILGRHADPVKKWINETVSDNPRAQIAAARKNKAIEPKSMDEIDAQNIEAAVIRVSGWQNVTQEFSKDLLRTVLQRNPHFVDQIIEESDNMANFSKGQSDSLPNTLGSSSD